MTSGAITFDCWRQFDERTKEAWREVVRIHGFDPNNVAFPLVIDGDTMVVTEYLRNEQDHLYWNDDRSGPATTEHEVRLQTEVGIPRRCRERSA